MGSGIALCSLLAGFEEVIIYDLNSEILENARSTIHTILKHWGPVNKLKQAFSENPTMINTNIDEMFEKLEDLGVLGEAINKEKIMERLTCETVLSNAVINADFVIEAIPENLTIKQEMFKQLGSLSPPRTILATNTSTMSITKIAAFSNRADKVVGIHFHNFQPLTARMIEVTPGNETSKETMEVAFEIATKLPSALKNKFVVRLEKESPGLIANRFTIVTGLYMDWIFDQAFEEGITIDQLITVGAISPAIDLIGIDVAYGCAEYFKEHVSLDFAPGGKLVELYDEGKLGRKTGCGYFEWDENGPIMKQVPIDAETQQKMESVFGLIDIEVLGAIGLNEGCRLLEEGVVKSYNLIDQTIKSGTYSDGPFMTGKNKYKEWSKKLEEIADKTGKSYLKPCDMMKTGKFLEFP
jgi:enoyl-CoA hydratase/3-hydroxyacyl-CoA dehydrogenase